MSSAETELGHVETEEPQFDTPGVGELQDVDEQEAARHLEELGDEAAQPADHPYDPGADPDKDPTARERADSQAAVTPSEDGRHFTPEYLVAGQGASGTLDGSLPGAAPRAGG